MNDADTAHPMSLAAPLALFFAAFFAIPLLLLLWVSLQGEGAPGLAQYARFFADGLGARVLLNTLRIGLETTLGCLLLCYPLALMFRAAPGWGRSVITLIVLLPLLTSVVVRTFAWIVILGRQGVVNSVLQSLGLIDLPLRLLYTEGGLVVALVQVQMPLMFLPLAGTLVRIAPNLEDASAALGAGAWRTFARVTLPLTLPGALAGCTLTFAAAVTAFITQSLVGGGQMLLMPSYIYQQAITLQNWPFAAAISMVFLAAVLAVLAALAALSRLSRGAAHV
ncbi:MAG: putative spermidine/putrescine transport system permease protein [Acetobacteraceae bacterium]|nr:putative spermidine/putrescine transport system permease protein [Acetobacteraceae bacterium]